MAKLKPKEWKELEASINQWMPTRLKIKGHEISIHLVRSGMKMKYEVWVDGRIKGEWLRRDSEIGKMFYFPKMTSKWKPSIVKEAVKVFGKREAIKRGFTDEKCLLMYYPYFTSFRSLKQVLSQHDDIEIL